VTFLTTQLHCLWLTASLNSGPPLEDVTWRLKTNRSFFRDHKAISSRVKHESNVPNSQYCRHGIDSYSLWMARLSGSGIDSDDFWNKPCIVSRASDIDNQHRRMQHSTDLPDQSHSRQALSAWSRNMYVGMRNSMGLAAARLWGNHWAQAAQTKMHGCQACNRSLVARHSWHWFFRWGVKSWVYTERERERENINACVGHVSRWYTSGGDQYI
jgi:hypothetical protein